MINGKLIDAYAFADMWRSYAITDEQRELSERVARSAEEFPEAKTENDRWNRLMMYLADLQLTYAPADGHGDEKIYQFVTGLIKELEGWENDESRKADARPEKMSDEELPPAQPQRMHGHWTEDKSCPFCRKQPWYEYDIHTLMFCPYCGADMREE